jgi:hypothetical protein
MSVAKAVIWKPSEHADEYIVFVDDVKEVSGGGLHLLPLWELMGVNVDC